MKISERLVERLRSDLGLDLPEGTRAVRTRRSRWQAEAGTWCWTLMSDFQALPFGSEDTMTDCVRAPSISVGHISRSFDTSIYAESRTEAPETTEEPCSES